MYNKYLEEYYIPEEELKVKIYGIIETLCINYPEEFNPYLIENINPQQDTSTILHNLIHLIPSIQEISHNFELVTELEALRMCAIILDGQNYARLLQHILLKVFYLLFGDKFIAFRYLKAVDIIENILNEELKYDAKRLYNEIINPQDKETISVYETLLAQEEIERVCKNENVKDFFWDSVETFETSIEKFVKQGLDNIAYETLGKNFFEAVIQNADLFDTSLDVKSPQHASERKELLAMLVKLSKSGTNFRLGIKHGGDRQRPGFNWTQENKEKFYQTIESIPKVPRKKNNKKENIYLWDYIYEQFESRGSAARKILEFEPGYESIPPDLLDEAFEKWQISEEKFTNLDKEFSPKMFLFRHALKILDFPQEHFNKRGQRFIPYKKSTLQKYYDSGQTSNRNLDNQDLS